MFWILVPVAIFILLVVALIKLRRDRLAAFEREDAPAAAETPGNPPPAP
jgi:hypothetical protein